MIGWQHKYIKLICVSVLLAATILRTGYSVLVSVHPTVVVQLPTKQAILQCNYTHAEDVQVNIRWERSRKGGNIPIILKKTNNIIRYGNGKSANNTRFGEGCTLVILEPTVRDTHVYKVTVTGFEDHSEESKDVRLVVIENNAKLYLHDRIQHDTTTEKQDPAEHSTCTTSLTVCAVLLVISVILNLLAAITLQWYGIFRKLIQDARERIRRYLGRGRNPDPLNQVVILDSGNGNNRVKENEEPDSKPLLGNIQNQSLQGSQTNTTVTDCVPVKFAPSTTDPLSRELGKMCFKHRETIVSVCINCPELICTICKPGHDSHTVNDLGTAYKESVEKPWLHVAAERGDLTICSLLMKAGCDKNIKDEKGNTPLHKAVICNREAVCNELLNNGSDVNVANKAKDSPLHIAAADGNLPLCKLLVEFSCDLNVMNKDNETALHKAVRANRKDICELLLQRRCKTQIKNLNNETPFEMAKREGNDELCKVIGDVAKQIHHQSKWLQHRSMPTNVKTKLALAKGVHESKAPKTS